MAELHFNLFVSAGHDFEGAQYRVLDGLQQVRHAFSQNVIYPHLGELIDLYGALQAFARQLQGFKDHLPKKIKDIDLEAGTVVYDRMELSHVSDMEELIQWALPQLQAAIEEGRAIFEFVEENLYLEEVGIVPSYVEEGYLLVPDRQAGTLHIMQYSLSIITQANERYRSLRTRHIRSIRPGGILPSPQSIKLQLLEEQRDLPNPATYFFDTDLDFPFEPTMLPVAKRKLMRYLFGGAA